MHSSNCPLLSGTSNNLSIGPFASLPGHRPKHPHPGGTHPGTASAAACPRPHPLPEITAERSSPLYGRHQTDGYSAHPSGPSNQLVFRDGPHLGTVPTAITGVDLQGIRSVCRMARKHRRPVSGCQLCASHHLSVDIQAQVFFEAPCGSSASPGRPCSVRSCSLQRMGVPATRTKPSCSEVLGRRLRWTRPGHQYVSWPAPTVLHSLWIRRWPPLPRRMLRSCRCPARPRPPFR